MSDTMPAPRNTIRLSNTPRGIRAAASLLNNGGLVAFPTETVYGLGADARQDTAVGAIYQAKGRPGFNPLIVHVSDLNAAQILVEMPEIAINLANVFWPGPLTLVLPLKPGAGISEKVTAGLSTLAIRVPEHATARALLDEFNGPIAAPSANISGKISPTNADHVLETLSGRIDAVIDAGPSSVGLESTIIGFEPLPVLLRPGGVSVEKIEAVTPITQREGNEISAPGQLASHYAPEVSLMLNALEGDFWLSFGPLLGRKGISLSDGANLTEAATNLFAALHEIDAMARKLGITKVHIDPIPNEGLGRAINDRLRRAATPR